MVRTNKEPGDGVEIANWDCPENEGIDKYTYAHRVEARLEELGLVGYRDLPVLEEEHASIFPGLDPGHYFDGRLPRVIRKLDLDQISALYSLYSNWYGYVIFQTRKVAAERSEAKRQKEFLWSSIRKQYKAEPDPDTGKKPSDQAVSDMARSDYRFVVADSQYEELNVLYNTMLSMCEVAEQDMSVVSREVTINQLKQQKELGGDNLPGSKNRAWMPGKEDRDDEDNKTQKSIANTLPARPGKIPSKAVGKPIPVKSGVKRPR